jgi:hypothetical protein
MLDWVCSMCLVPGWMEFAAHDGPHVVLVPWAPGQHKDWLKLQRGYELPLDAAQDDPAPAIGVGGKCGCFHISGCVSVCVCVHICVRACACVCV